MGWGKQKVKYTNTFNWSAHHNDNNNILGIIWDFINGIPQIICVMYSELEKKDWGNPRKIEGNKCTNGYSLNSDGIKKMKKGILCIIDDDVYIEALNFELFTGEIKELQKRYQNSGVSLW